MRKRILDLIQGLMDVVQGEQNIRSDMQHEINVLRRQIVELRFKVYGIDEDKVLVEMPKLTAAMQAKEN